jgi:ribonucleoside-diphosphate reductase alpha chain
MVQIEKRDGTIASFNPNKILNRIKKAAKGLKVNSDQIFINVITTLPVDGTITTKQLDEVVSGMAAQYTSSHYDYSKLASGIAISSYHKSTKNFVDTMMYLHEDGIIHPELITKITNYGVDRVNALIKDENDYNFDYFAWKSLQTIYLLKDHKAKSVERPQHMYLRVALWLTDTFEEAEEFYNDLSNQLPSMASPIMMNSGTVKSQLASCVLHFNDGDSREKLIDTIRDISLYSSAAAGIGLCLSNIRSKESTISTSGGFAGGFLKFSKIINECLRFFNQNGKRAGSCAIYIEPWHKDIEDFLEIRLPQGKDESRARDVFTAIWTPDNFMRAVEEEGDYYLFCPNDIKKAGLKPFYEIYGAEFEEEYAKGVALGIGKKVKAMDLWMKIMKSQIETGAPYILYKDSVNEKSNQKNIGTIKQSNLCIDENAILDVRIDHEMAGTLTFKGLLQLFKTGKNIEIQSFNEKTKEIEYQKILNVVLTNQNAEVIKITDEDSGKELICTPDHEVYTSNRGYVQAKNLKENDILIFNS